MAAETPAPEHARFLCDIAEVVARIERIDPVAYDHSRNDLGGATTWLGPFLTHGITDTSEVAERVLDPHREPSAHARDACYRLLFELGWREFFHRTWELEGEAIFGDLHHRQRRVASEDLPRALLEARTGIDAVDRAIAHLIEHGTMHNHARLWSAAIACNFARTWWPNPSRWLYHHLLDGDLASNTLSWQWVAGTFGSKRYVANQENVNRFSGTDQRGTWLDLPYEALDDLPVPERLRPRAPVALPCPLRGRPVERLEGSVALRSIWHLDPRWEHSMERELVFVDTDHLAAWPLSEKRWDFIEHWAGHCKAEIVHGSVAELARAAAGARLLRRDYPACEGWPGEVERRRWLYPMPDEAFPSFFRYWKQVRGSLGL